MSSPENPKLKAMLYVCGCASARVHVNVGILFVQSLSIARATLSGECPRVGACSVQRFQMAISDGVFSSIGDGTACSSPI